MPRRCFLIPLLAVALAGCATPPDGAVTPRLARLPPEELARLAPDAKAKLTLDDLVAMAKSGASAAAMTARFRASGARFKLTPTQIVDLHGRGVPLPVLEAIHASDEQALRTDLTQALVDAEKKYGEQLAQAQQRARLLSQDAFCPRPYGWGYPDPWRRGPYWGW